MLAHLAAANVRVVNYVLTAVAVIVTCVRLWDRTRTGRVWWDDAWAAFTMMILIIFMAVVDVHLQDPAKHSMKVKLIIAYLCPVLFYPVTWSARISILLTIIRISLGTLRTVLKWTGFAFFLTWSLLFAQIWWVCEDSPKWKQTSNPQCPLGTEVVVAQVITDVLSDAILIVAPLCLVWRTKLSRPQKIRVTAIFSTTLITTAVSLNHAYFVLKRGGVEEALAAVIQCCICLVVANLSVIIALFFRITTEEDDTMPDLPTFSAAMGRATGYFLSWQRRPAISINSSLVTTDERLRDSQDPVPTGTTPSRMEDYSDMSYDAERGGEELTVISTFSEMHTSEERWTST